MNSLEKEDDLDRALSGQSKAERLIGSVAAMICSNAFELRLSHTIDGEWPDNELGVKAEHDAMLELVGELGRLKRSCSEIPNDWTHKLNSCRFHDDDRAACATYSGQVPCDAGHSADDSKMVEGDYMRAAFELDYSNNMAWPQAVERNQDGQYKYAGASAAWETWQRAWAASKRYVSDAGKMVKGDVSGAGLRFLGVGCE